MRFEKISLVLLILSLIAINPLFADTEEEKDFAVPAFGDFQLLATQNQTQNANLAKAEPNLLPSISQIRQLDLNGDRQLNDFDAEQFQDIVESLRGEKLTGLQLVLRFRTEQKNQRESFPLLYDLDRDGMFTTFDVDAFSKAISHLDEGADRGEKLVQNFKLQLFPKENK